MSIFCIFTKNEGWYNQFNPITEVDTVDKSINIGSRREVCWDEYLWEKAEGIRVAMHRPEYRGVALRCD